MLRHDEGLGDWAAFRLDHAIRIARSVVVALALKRRRVRRKVRKLWRKHPDTGWAWWLASSLPSSGRELSAAEWARLDSNQGPTDYESAALTS
jgi:hypothetical protein